MGRRGGGVALRPSLRGVRRPGSRPRGRWDRAAGRRRRPCRATRSRAAVWVAPLVGDGAEGGFAPRGVTLASCRARACVVGAGERSCEYERSQRACAGRGQSGRVGMGCGRAVRVCMVSWCGVWLRGTDVGRVGAGPCGRRACRRCGLFWFAECAACRLLRRRRAAVACGFRRRRTNPWTRGAYGEGPGRSQADGPMLGGYRAAGCFACVVGGLGGRSDELLRPQGRCWVGVLRGVTVSELARSISRYAARSPTLHPCHPHHSGNITSASLELNPTRFRPQLLRQMA